MPVSRPSPGMVISAFLQAEGQASVAEMHRAYKEARREEDVRRKQMGMTARGSMTYSSFRTYVTKAEKLGLVEKVGEKPIEHGDWGDGMPLVGVKDSKVIPARQVVYQLTSKGQEASAQFWASLQYHYNQSL